MMHSAEHDPLQPHSHDNNETPPSDDTTITLTLPDGVQHRLALADMATLPQSALPNHTLQTDHGAHGPYTFSGVALRDLVAAFWSGDFAEIEVISADGYGNRVFSAELATPTAAPMLLCTHSNGQPLGRQFGLVRLIVPSETDNALRQIKWVATIRVV